MLDGKPVTPSSTGSVPSLCCNTQSLLLHSALQGENRGGKAKTLPFITQTQRRIRQNCAKPWSDLYRVVKEQKIRHAVYRFFEAKSTVI